MKRLLIILSTILSAIPLSAQKPLENDEIFATVGVNVPMYKCIESDMVVGLHYGHYYPNGVGFRTGSRTISAKLNSAAHGIARTQVYDEGDALKYGLLGEDMD